MKRQPPNAPPSNVYDLCRYNPTERVSVVYPDDTYGTIAASAFVRAVRSTEGVNVGSNAAGEMPATIEIVRRFVQ